MYMLWLFKWICRANNFAPIDLRLVFGTITNTYHMVLNFYGVQIFMDFVDYIRKNY